MSILTTGSSFITSLESKITVDLCLGKFFVNIHDSVFVTGGEAGILGVKLKIKNPYGVIIKNFPIESTYDKSGASLKNDIEVIFPKEFNTFLYGTYEVSVLITDSSNKSFTITKQVSVPEVDSEDPSANFRWLSGSINAIAKEVSVYITLNSPELYLGFASEVQSGQYILYYPTASGKPNLSFSSQNIKVPLFNGVYVIKGTSCVSYNVGNNVTVSIPHHIEFKKELLLSLNYGCIFKKLSEISKMSDCTSDLYKLDAEYRNTLGILILIETAKIATDEGRDPTEYIIKLNEALGCNCYEAKSDIQPILPFDGKVRVNSVSELDFLIDQLDVVPSNGISANWGVVDGKATLVLGMNGSGGFSSFSNTGFAI